MNLVYHSEMKDFVLKQAHIFDAGCDIPVYDERLVNGEYSSDGKYILNPGEAITLKTGIYVAIPEGYYGCMDARSSTSKIRLALLCHTIDSEYRGNIRLAIINLNKEPVVIENGICYFQIIIQKCEQLNTEKFDTIETFLEAGGKTKRGDSGFGSTGMFRKEGTV